MYPLVTQSDTISSTVLLPAEGECAARFADAGTPVDIVQYPDALDKFNRQLLQGEYLSTSVALLRYQFRLVSYFRKKEFDVLYCNNLRSLLLFGLAAKMVGLPVVWFVRIDTPEAYLDRIGLQIADKVLTISDGVRSRFGSHTMSGTDRFETVYTGVDTDMFDPSVEADEIPEVAEDRVVVTQVSTIQERKGQHHLVSSIERIDDQIPPTQVVFAGDCPPGQSEYEATLRSTIAENDVSTQFTFLGWFDRVPDLLKTTDVFVLPSHNEGFPRSVLEALAMEVPVVATNTGGTDEVVSDGENGFLVEIGDDDALSVAIRQLVRDNYQRERMGERGRRDVEHNFTLQHYLNRFEESITNVC
jgi:glycosyltransferase involved in cell wall biosynthesis